MDEQIGQHPKLLLQMVGCRELGVDLQRMVAGVGLDPQNQTHVKKAMRAPDARGCDDVAFGNPRRQFIDATGGQMGLICGKVWVARVILRRMFADADEPNTSAGGMLMQEPSKGCDRNLLRCNLPLGNPDHLP